MTNPKSIPSHHLAYGLLWRGARDDKALTMARRWLLSTMTHAEQRAAIVAAVELHGPAEPCCALERALLDALEDAPDVQLPRP